MPGTVFSMLRDKQRVWELPVNWRRSTLDSILSIRQRTLGTRYKGEELTLVQKSVKFSGKRAEAEKRWM